MKQKKVVKYPSSINNMFVDIEKITRPITMVDGEPLINLIKKSNLPKGAKFGFHKAHIGLVFYILLPSGEIFAGAAIKDKRDMDDLLMAMVRAAGRAIAVYNNIYAPDKRVSKSFFNMHSGSSITTSKEAIS